MITWFNFFTVGITATILLLRFMLAYNDGEAALSIYSRWLSKSTVFSLIMIILALYPMQSGYYFYVLKPILFITGIIGIFALFSAGLAYSFQFLLLIIFSILYNPYIPVIFGHGYKYLWIILNGIFLMLLFYVISDIDDADVANEPDPVISKINAPDNIPYTKDYSELLCELESLQRNLEIAITSRNKQMISAFMSHYITLSFVIYSTLLLLHMGSYITSNFLIINIFIALIVFLTTKAVITKQQDLISNIKTRITIKKALLNDLKLN